MYSYYFVIHSFISVCIGLYKQLPHQLMSDFNFLVSNPPYVTSDEMLCLEPEILR